MIQNEDAASLNPYPIAQVDTSPPPVPSNPFKHGLFDCFAAGTGISKYSR